MHKMINTKYYKEKMNVPYVRMRGLSLNGECKTKVISHTHNSTAGVTFLTLQTTPAGFTTPCHMSTFTPQTHLSIKDSVFSVNV